MAIIMMSDSTLKGIISTVAMCVSDDTRDISDRMDWIYDEIYTVTHNVGIAEHARNCVSAVDASKEDID